MFGKRNDYQAPVAASPAIEAPSEAANSDNLSIAGPHDQHERAGKPADYYALKKETFAALIETIDVAQISKLETSEARDDIADIMVKVGGMKWS